MLYIFCRFVVRVILKAVYQVRVKDADRVPLEGPVVVCANHRSLLDPPIVASFMKPKLRFMAKAELFQIPIFSGLIRRLGAFPVNRGGMSMETMRTAIKVVKEGEMLLIFPEGTRQKTGQLGTGKKGAASIALRGNARILPAAIIGDYRLFRPMKVVYGEAFDANESVAHLPSSEKMDALTQIIMDSIQDLISRNG